MSNSRQQPGEVSTLTTSPRVCMATCRDFKKKAFHAAHYEAQDVLCETADVDLIHLEPAGGYQFKEKWQRRLLYRDVTRKLIFQNPGLRRVKLTKEYDLFVAYCQTHQDLLNINAIYGWKDHCKTSVLWMDEMWAAAIPEYKYWIHVFNRFDHVFIGSSGTVEALSSAISKPCHWLSGGVDTLRFSPYPNPPRREVDVYSIGRRVDGIHRRLFQGAEQGSVFYVYDTFMGSLTELYDCRQHRELFANIAKRSRFFMVAPGKVDISDETKGQVEIGFRYYEGAAAGAVMLGQAPNCDSFKQMFPWEDAVISLRPDGSDALEAISSLSSEPERFAAISRKNASEALLRHDWVYRWKEMFRVAGMEPSTGMITRESRLKELGAIAASPIESKDIASSLR